MKKLLWSILPLFVFGFAVLISSCEDDDVTTNSTTPAVVPSSVENCIVFVSEGTSTLQLSKSGSPTFTPTLYYSTDGKSWYNWDFSEISYSTLYLAGNNKRLGESVSDYYYFIMGGDKAGCSGNIMALLDCSNPSGASLADFCFANLFFNCRRLTSAPELPATTLSEYCYRSMFQSCTALENAPDLLATTLADSCYRYMFYGCTNLNYIRCLATNVSASASTTNWLGDVASTGTFIKAKEIEAGNGGWEYRSSNGIPSGWTVKNEGQADGEDPEDCLIFRSEGVSTLQLLSEGDPDFTPTLRYSDDGVIWNDWDLSELSYSTLYLRGVGNTMFASSSDVYYYFAMGGDNAACDGNIMLLLDYENPGESIPTECCFYRLFSECSALSSAPELPATTLSVRCYGYMFYNCTSLTTAPELPATKLEERCYQYMFRGCSGLTTAPELPATELAKACYYYMFRDCTALTTASALPATTMVSQCYADMYYGCTALNSVPELKATTLADSCYRYMFYKCSNLDYIKCLATDISATQCTKYWLYQVASSGTFVKAKDMNSWGSGSDGIPSNWTVVDNEE